MTETIRIEANDVQSRLTQLGLEETRIADVVRRGYIAFISCTVNDPPLFPGFSAWARMVRGLREYLVPQDWERSDDNNYSLVVNPSGTIAIAVATGDEATGCRDATPTTKSSRGTCTIDAVTVNSSQLSLFDFPPLPSEVQAAKSGDKRLTWILLVHRSTNEIRCELSLPRSMGDDSRFDSWQERIILGSIPIDSDMIDVLPSTPPQPDVTVAIKRRA